MLRVRLAVSLVVVSAATAEATLSSSFRSFLKNQYGQEVDVALARDDYGPGGSFGGGNHLERTQTK